MNTDIYINLTIKNLNYIGINISKDYDKNGN